MKTYLHYLVYKIRQDWKYNKQENMYMTGIGALFGLSLGGCICLPFSIWLGIIFPLLGASIFVYTFFGEQIKDWVQDEKENFRKWRNEKP